MEDSIRVLHVEDEPDFAGLVSTFLEREDERISVLTATTPADGLELLAESHVDCIVSDYDLPDQNGIEFLEAVRERYPDLPFMLYTGKGSEEVAGEAISKGVTDYLQKSSGSSQYTVLANRIRNSVEQHRAQNKLADRERQLNLFFEQSPLGVIRWDDSFNFARLNGTAERILGYSEAELVGESWDVVVPETSRVGVHDGIVSDLLENEGGYYSINENVRKDGELIVCEWHNHVVTDENDGVVAVFSQFQDVTERQEQQKELERHRAVTQAATNTILTIDEANTIQSVNPAVEGTFGYAPDEILGKELTMLMSEDTADLHRAAFEQYLETGEKTVDWNYVEFPGQHRDGSPIPLSLSIGEVTFENDRFFVGIIRDITERKARERELEQARDRFRKIFEASNDAIFVLDLDTESIVDANPRAEELLGYSREELVTSVSLSDIHPADLEQYQTFLNQIYTGDTGRRADFQCVTKSGEPKECEISVAATDVDDNRYLITTVRDMTERREREEEIKDRERALRRAYEIIADGDRSVSEQINGLLEVGRGLLGTNYATFSHIHSDRYEFEAIAVTPGIDLEAGETTDLAELPICGQVFRTGRPVVLNDVETEAPELVDSTWGIACYLGAPVVVDEVPYGTFCFYDTEPRSEEFTDWETTFVELLGDWVGSELTRHRATERLQRQNERLDEFAGVVSHDLRNPLNVAEGRLELGREDCDNEHLEEVERAHTRMQTLIDDLLTLARRGDTVTDDTSVALSALVEECWEIVETADATLVVDIDRTVRGDASRLKQLFENLIRNAVEHGGTDVTVTVGELDDGFYIEDDGPGIPEGNRAEVFEPGHSTSTEGTGFGLSIAKQVSEAHNWTIDVMEGSDGGARFEITRARIPPE